MRQFTPMEYLQIDIANNFGLDTLNWDDRLQWFMDNENKLDSLLSQAKEPALFFAGVKAWRQVLNGEAIGYPISLDATASGFQILACLTGDRQAAELCNVVNTGNRLDAYTVINGVTSGDTIMLEGATKFSSTKVALSVGADESLLNYANQAAKVLAQFEMGWFQRGGNTFIVQDRDGNNSFDNGADMIVMITGVVDLGTGASYNVDSNTLTIV